MTDRDTSNKTLSELKRGYFLAMEDVINFMGTLKSDDKYIKTKIYRFCTETRLKDK
jgi:hypothetical protein